MSLLEHIKDKRPNISASSARTYESILRNMYKKVFPDDKELDFKKFDDDKSFMDLLKDIDFSKRKTYLASLVIITDNDKYRKQMLDDGAEHNDKKKNQQKSQKETENWVSQDELKLILDKSQAEFKSLLKLNELTKQQIQQAQNYIILSLVSGLVLGSVRRSQDWCELKFKNYDTEQDNCLVQNKKEWEFIFNIYKTNKSLGKQQLSIPKGFKSILTKWIKVLEKFYPNNNYLLVDVSGNKLYPSKLTQRLNKIFGKKASVNIMRKSHITDKYKDIPALKQMIDDATANGHSLSEELSYIKR
jgi:hypothetical protein